MNKQETEWAGEFGSEYVKRSPGNVTANRNLFIRAMGQEIALGQIERVVEFGAGAGSNIAALRGLLPRARLDAVEINTDAIGAMVAKQCADSIYQTSMLEWVNPNELPYDLAFTKGVLIHIHADDLQKALGVLYRSSRRYILVAEYFAPRRTEIEYRGRRDLLWKDDFAGYLLDAHADLELVNYGFISKRDRFPQDDLNWWLMEKKGGKP